MANKEEPSLLQAQAGTRQPRREAELELPGTQLCSTYRSLPILWPILIDSQRITNARVKASSKPHLLALPAHIRDTIFRMAVVQPHPILISTHEVNASSEPGLLSVSHDVREEVLKIFYAGNDFELVVHDFDAAALVPWLETAERHRAVAAVDMVETEGEEYEEVFPMNNSTKAGGSNTLRFSPTQMQMLEAQRTYHAAPKTFNMPGGGGTSWTIPFEPVWYNLVQWLKLFHAGKLLGPPKDGRDSAGEKAAFAVFDVVESLKGEEWAVVEKMLPGLREVLGAGDPRWFNVKVWIVKDEEEWANQFGEME